ncbi:two-component regulator propeller domain-containing protein [Flammeovirgaceae bacterium SG7u.111]|nr:two-component regulator propeller domain-containing protein [Flammeovirgaceae bacterium SG7u.132]WPO33683.1 two-component regulator propeller domain-containing protein [Flammeovirgaceae bacterium SG7u.111]
MNFLYYLYYTLSSINRPFETTLKGLGLLSWLLVALSHSSKAEDLFFSTLSMKDGLPSNIMAGIAQDKHGFLWVATGGGLARYDGYDFDVFKKDISQNSLPSNELTAIVAQGGYVWVGSWGGLCKVNTETFEVTRIKLDSSEVVRTLHLGKNNILWVGTGNGLVRYELDSQTQTLFDKHNSALSHNMVRSLYEDDKGILWVGTYNGLNRLDPNTKKIRSIELDKPSIPENNLILDIKPFSTQADSLIWIGTETGIHLLNTHTFVIEKLSKEEIKFSNEVIKCVYTDAEEKLWLGTDFGLNIVDTKKNSLNVHFHNPKKPYSITSNVIWQIFEDAGGIIWFATSNGLARVNKHSNFYSFQEVSHSFDQLVIGNQVKSILIDSEGNYWLATQYGVELINKRTGKKTTFSTDSPSPRKILLNNVYALEEDIYGRIWIGTAGGINVWDKNTNTMTSITASDKNGLTSNYVGNFSQQPDGTLWVSYWHGGVFKIDGDFQTLENIRFIPVKNLSTGSEKHIFGRGYLWYNENDKLLKVDPSTLKATSVTAFDEVAANKTIYSIYFSNKGDLWATTSNGFIQYSPKYGRAEFYPINTGVEIILTSLIEDDNGNIWGSSNTSLLKISPNNYHIDIYPLDKNLPINNFYYGCAAIDKKGELIFGGDNGFIVFDPKNVVPNRYKPPVYITSLEVNNKKLFVSEENNLLIKDIPFTSSIELEYQERSVSFEFSSLFFWQPETNFYAYKLEGFDEDWKYVSGAKNIASYSKLPVGNYIFKVKGSNNFGDLNGNEASLSLTVSPPFFLSKFFIAAYIILAVLAIYYALRIYSQRVHLKNELKITLLENEHAKEIEKTKEHFFTNISHELRTPISLILPPIHEIQKGGDLNEKNENLISLAEKNSRRLLKLVNQILDFNKIETDTLQLNVSQVEMVSFCQEVVSLFTDKAKRHDIELTFSNKIPEQTTWVDAEKIETVLFNLLSNAFKFTPNGGKVELTIDIDEASQELKEGAIVFKISDTGIGISPEEQTKIFERFYQTKDGKKMGSSSGIGLTLAAEYVELHHGSIKVESEVDQGTTFTALLPLGTKHLPMETIDSNENINLLAKKSVHGRKGGSTQFQFDLESDKPLVLLIEDNNDIVEFIRNSLSHKYNFISAENGEEGLVKANSFLPQVIVSDIMMPIMDGLTFCGKVKENPKTSHVGIILLTAKSLTSQRVEGIRKGADAYITKPFEIDLLEAYIDHLIHRTEELTNYFNNELIRLPSDPDAMNNEDTKFVKQVMDIIEANISNSNLSVEMISNEMAMSSTHLYRKLKATTDHSANEIIKKYRLKKASILLQNKEGNITDIMYDVGFSSLSYFSKCFKAEYGLPPKKYQENMGKKTVF